MFICTQLGLVKSLDNSLYESFQINMFDVDITVKVKEKLAKARYNMFGHMFLTSKTTFKWKKMWKKQWKASRHKNSH